MNKNLFLCRFIVNQGRLFLKNATHQKQLSRNCCIRRALLYVPGSDVKKLEKAFQLDVDCVVMDCEDGVALNQKVEARENIRKFLDKGNATKSNPEWSVRINPVQTPDLCEAEINSFLSAKSLPASICLPKVNNTDQLQWFAEKVWNALIKRPENDRGPIKLIMLIESAIAFINLVDICKKAEDLASVAPIVPVGLILGSDDLLASIGAKRTPSGIELLYARQKMVLIAKAFGLQAIDMVFLDYKDNVGFQQSCQDGAIMGYTGKQVIHPNQVVIAQDEFVPSRSQIHWAKSVIKAFKENQEKGKGAFTFENQMIDMPTVKQAENIVNAATAAGKLTDSEWSS